MAALTELFVPKLDVGELLIPVISKLADHHSQHLGHLVVHTLHPTIFIRVLHPTIFLSLIHI